MYRRFLLWSSGAAFLAVGFGAFGAHGLRGVLDERMMAIYQTAVHYHFLHALGLGLIAVLAKWHPDARLLGWAGGMMAAGIVLFSGSLYVLSVTGVGWLGAITPIGGTAWLAAWLLLGIFAFRLGDQPRSNLKSPG
jgi:uncharacterized membrane protein YgdD (TMEM256/DUF423 family)